MPYFMIEQPGVPIIRAPLRGSETTLGRAEDNSIILVADEVSRHHAKVVARANRFLIIDLNSLNGTYVNGQRVIERTLTDRDEIWLGSKCKLVFHDDRAVDNQSKVADEGDQYVSTDVDVDSIRADLDRLGRNMTLLGKTTAGPIQVETGQGLVAGLELQELGRAYARLASLYKANTEVSKLIASNAELPDRLSKVLDVAIEVTGAERGFIMLRDEQTGALRVHTARKMGQDLQAGSPSMGIAGRAAETGKPVLMRDAQRDREFAGRESIIRQRISSAMCAPLNVEDRILGSIYVDTRKPDFSFTEQDLELFASVASQSALAVDNVRLYRRMIEAEKKRATLGRFLSPSVVETIMTEDKEPELGGRKQTVATLFCDIRGFTPLAERLAPGDLLYLLNEHFTAMVEIVFKFQGTLDKFIGDEIMALFGAPLSHEDDPERAVCTAVEMQLKNRELNQTRTIRGQPVFEMGIGIATGEVIAGLVGSPQRMDFTVVGDRVNTARRLCSLAAPGQIIICETTRQHLDDRFLCRRIGTVALKGKELPVRAFEVGWSQD